MVRFERECHTQCIYLTSTSDNIAITIFDKKMFFVMLTKDVILASRFTEFGNWYITIFCTKMCF